MKHSYKWIIPNTLEAAKELWKSWKESKEVWGDSSKHKDGQALHSDDNNSTPDANIVLGSCTPSDKALDTALAPSMDGGKYTTLVGNLPHRRRCFSEKKIRERCSHHPAGDYSKEIEQFWTQRGMSFPPTPDQIETYKSRRDNAQLSIGCKEGPIR